MQQRQSKIKKFQRPLLGLLLVLSVTGTSRTSAANNCAATEEILESCSTALEDQLDLNIEQTRLINMLKSAAIVREERVKELEEASQRWYANPAVVALMGLTVGIVAGGYLSKR